MRQWLPATLMPEWVLMWRRREAQVSFLGLQQFVWTIQSVSSVRKHAQPLHSTAHRAATTACGRQTHRSLAAVCIPSSVPACCTLKHECVFSVGRFGTPAGAHGVQGHCTDWQQGLEQGAGYAASPR
eukprot:GHRR01026462.1.p2 GENE.GHRR01026462.1~~GHRR01026462.1.p2  ORF type:complete len:127 (+),score=30.80 GHRR01026462.1:702-1082(+)